MNEPFDSTRLERYLVDRGLLGGPIELRRIGDGHSNLTYLVTDGERGVVVRRPPPPPIPPGGHDVVREARFQRALGPAGVAVPRILAVEESDDIIEAPFYVMEHLVGHVVTDTTPEALDAPEHRRAIGEALVDALADLHAVDAVAVGLAEPDRKPRDPAQQLQRFSQILASMDEGLPAELAELLDHLLEDPPPADSSAVVHGDFRIGNVMLAPEAPARVLAILDWELAAIGDPIADLAYFLATFADPAQPAHALTELGVATTAAGYPSRGELADRYVARTGRDIGRLDWHITVALWKLTVLFEYQRRRAQSGIGDSYYRDPGLVPGLLAAARRTTQGAFS